MLTIFSHRVWNRASNDAGTRSVSPPLEAIRRPALRQTFEAMQKTAIDFTYDQHRALGLSTSRQDVETLIALYGGALFALITGQAGESDAATCGALARTMVAGIAS